MKDDKRTPLDTRFTTASLIERGRETLSLNYCPRPLVASHGEGAWLFDREGRPFLDCIAGIGVSALGYGHPELTAAVKDQVDRLLHISNMYFNEPQVLLQDAVCKSSFVERVYLANSGTEANEAAIKLARRLQSHVRGDAERVEIVAAESSFHGRTMGSIAATGQPKYWVGFQPLPGGFRHVPFGDLGALEAVVGEKTCAVMLEPVQGEGGVRPATRAYLEGVRALCDAKGALLIFDEVQCGVGRLGTLWAYEAFGVQPDIVTWAKGLGGGLPIGLMGTTEAAAPGFTIGSHASTFGGNPVAARAAGVVLEVLQREGFLESVKRRGARLSAGLSEVASRYDALGEVRGVGLMIGVEAGALAKEIQAAAFAEGLLLNTAGGVAVRFLPPLVIEEAEIDEALIRFERAVKRAIG